MNDWEYDLLDELYFLCSYQDLENRLPEQADNLKIHLESLIKNGWIKAMEQKTDEEISDLSKFNLFYKEYNYLATKAGLFAHNSKE